MFNVMRPEVRYWRWLCNSFLWRVLNECDEHSQNSIICTAPNRPSATECAMPSRSSLHSDSVLCKLKLMHILYTGQNYTELQVRAMTMTRTCRVPCIRILDQCQITRDFSSGWRILIRQNRLYSTRTCRTRARARTEHSLDSEFLIH